MTMDTHLEISGRPRAQRRVTVVVGTEHIQVRSLRGAVDLLRSLRADISGEQADRLCAQMSAARTPAEMDAAWQAFCRWTGACGLLPGNGGGRPFKRAA